MTNLLIVFASAFAVGEVIINVTKDMACKKLDPVVYCSIVFAVCGIIGIAYDIFFNAPTIDLVYVVESIFLILAEVIIPQVGFDKAKELLEAIQKVNKR